MRTVMIDPYYYNKTLIYFRDEVMDPAAQDNYTIPFYSAFQTWLLTEYRCLSNGTNCLSFDREEDMTWFILRWS